MDTKSPDFNSYAQSFLNFCAIERGLSVNTVAAYRRDLEKFAQFMMRIPKTEITPKVISDFEAELRSAKLSPSSINRIDSTLRAFFQHVEKEQGVSNPTLEIVNNIIHRKLPKALRIDEVIRLIESSFREGEPITIRDRTMLELLYSSGSRVSELININLNDFSTFVSEDGSVATLKLRGKGGKERVVPLGSFATKAVDEYLVRLRPALAAKSSKTTNALFLNARGSRITRQSAWNIVLNAAQVSGITEKVSPHVFRHSYATHLLDGGADIRVVQELLGHASVTTTQIYTLVTIDKVRESYAMAHPRA